MRFVFPGNRRWAHHAQLVIKSAAQWSCWLATWFTSYFVLDNESAQRKRPIAEHFKPPWASCYHTFLWWFIFALWKLLMSVAGMARSLRMENSCKLYWQEAEGNHLGRWCAVWGLIDWVRDPRVMQAEGHKHTVIFFCYTNSRVDEVTRSRLDLNNSVQLHTSFSCTHLCLGSVPCVWVSCWWSLFALLTGSQSTSSVSWINETEEEIASGLL